MKNNVKTGVYVNNGQENTFNYYSTLRVYDKLKFVNFVTDTLIDDNYNSVMRDIVFDIAIVDIMTDVDVSSIFESNDVVNKIEDFLDETNIVEIVKANVGELIDELNDAVDKNIEYRTGIHRNPIVESLSSLLDTIEKKVSGIDTESMMKMAKVISGISGELNANKVLEAYAKSDLFKERFSKLINNKDSSNSERTENKNARGKKKDDSIK